MWCVTWRAGQASRLGPGGGTLRAAVLCKSIPSPPAHTPAPLYFQHTSPTVHHAPGANWTASPPSAHNLTTRSLKTPLLPKWTVASSPRGGGGEAGASSKRHRFQTA